MEDCLTDRQDLDKGEIYREVCTISGVTGVNVNMIYDAVSAMQCYCAIRME